MMHMTPSAEDPTESIRMTSLKARLDLGNKMDNGYATQSVHVYTSETVHIHKHLINMFILVRMFCVLL